jgi:deazaflavin-dependent oxidoreductase (nitroreductase family)
MARRAFRLAVRRLIAVISRVTSPVTVPLARSGLIPFWGVVEHRGRRSGKTYRTPIAIRATPDGFVLPLPFGDRVDWCRNLLAGGGGTIHWEGADHAVVHPEIIDGASAAPAFNAYMRAVLRLFRVRKAIRVRRAVVTNARPLVERTS